METKFKVLNIDAWTGMEENTWQWNNWFNFGEYDENEYGELNKENALKYFADQLANPSKVNEYDVDDDQYNLVLIRKDTLEPILAIEYGSHF